MVERQCFRHSQAALDTLKTTYGKPDVIMESLIEKAENLQRHERGGFIVLTKSFFCSVFGPSSRICPPIISGPVLIHLKPGPYSSQDRSFVTTGPDLNHYGAGPNLSKGRSFFISRSVLINAYIFLLFSGHFRNCLGFF